MSGEKKALRLVAKYADACNLVATTPEEVGHEVDVLHRHCEDVGRDPAEVEKTVIGSWDGGADPDGFLREVAAYAAPGVTTVWTGPTGSDPEAPVNGLLEALGDRLADV